MNDVGEPFGDPGRESTARPKPARPRHPRPRPRPRPDPPWVIKVISYDDIDIMDAKQTVEEAAQSDSPEVVIEFDTADRDFSFLPSLAQWALDNGVDLHLRGPSS